MDNESDLQFEAFLEEYLDENRTRVIEEFGYDRVREIYLSNPDIARPLAAILEEPRTIAATSPTGAVVLAYAVTEVAIKKVLWRPIVFSYVNSVSLADLFVDMLVDRRGLDKYYKIILTLMNEHAGVDIAKPQSALGGVTLWEGIQTISKRRDAAVHRAEKCSAEEAAIAIGIAVEVLGRILPAVLERYRLHTHPDYRICGEYNEEEARAKFIAEIPKITGRPFPTEQ